MRGNGFTLLEVMLSMTILALLAGLSLPVYESFMRRNDLDLTTQQLASSLRRAQTFARAGNHDSAWSVEVQPTVVTLFRGTNFSARDQTYDETVAIPPTIGVSGLSEVQFAKLTATPNATGTITLTSTANATRTVTVNAKGMVEY
ncbi:MAG TPA: type II secretion system protein [Candidatus Saccharibacteria bacterium]|nr:type II secretion system protein [Candidatus Saccharibacteria bacterium]HRK94166.1 type II secretion system protein [Candidatus Saccharibacteria bacterium]